MYSEQLLWGPAGLTGSLMVSGIYDVGASFVTDPVILAVFKFICTGLVNMQSQYRKWKAISNTI